MSYGSGGGTGLVPTALPSSFTERIELAAVPSQVRVARRWAAGLLSGPNHALGEDLIEAAVLLVSELVTNAIRADSPVPDPARRSGRGKFSLLIIGAPGTVRIEVHDSAGGRPPLPGNRGTDAETGRGLAVIATLSRRWGWEADQRGKVVWCELPV
jgi:hypothetical protein